MSVSTNGSTISIIGGQAQLSRFINEPILSSTGGIGQSNSVVSVFPLHPCKNYLAMSGMQLGALLKWRECGEYLKCLF